MNEGCTIDGFMWRCHSKAKNNPHDVWLSIRHGTWFAASNLTLEEIIELTYLWILGSSLAQMAQQIEGLSTKTTVDWANFCRELIEEVMLQDTESGQQIGGGASLWR